MQRLEFLSVAVEDIRGKDLEAEAESSELNVAWEFINTIWSGMTEAQRCEFLMQHPELAHSDSRVRRAALSSSCIYLKAVEVTWSRYFVSRLNPSPVSIAETLLSDPDECVRVQAAHLLSLFAEYELSQRRTPQQTSGSSKSVVSKLLYDCQNHLSEVRCLESCYYGDS